LRSVWLSRGPGGRLAIRICGGLIALAGLGFLLGLI